MKTNGRGEEKGKHAEIRTITESIGPGQLSEHARTCIQERGISVKDIENVLSYGRIRRTRAAEIHVVGRKEVNCLAPFGVDLKHCEGVHVVCEPLSGVVMTAYRNHDLSRLKPCKKGHTRRRARRLMSHAETLELA